MFGVGVENVVDQLQHMRGFAGRPGDKRIAVPMRQHQRREHMPVTRGQTVNVVRSNPCAAGGRKGSPYMSRDACVGGVDDFDLATASPRPAAFSLRFTSSSRPTTSALPSRSVDMHGGAQHARVVAFGKDHPRLSRAGAGVDRAQDDAVGSIRDLS